MPEFLSRALEERRTVRVFTTNGFQMEGQIVDVDTAFRHSCVEHQGQRALHLHERNFYDYIKAPRLWQRRGGARYPRQVKEALSIL